MNILKNSIEAMDGVAENRRTMTLSTHLDAAITGHIVCIVHDTGMGFSEDEKGRLFTLGYTTKNRGTGFGLHSSANYLIAHKGSISAHSNGKGKGAEFRILLPWTGG